MDSRYVIGVDLGTTNTTVAFADLQKSPHIRSFSIRQLVDVGVYEKKKQLPSFCLLGEEKPIVGELARDFGAKVPTRQVASAKSWLSHSQAARQSPILPVAGSEKKISPVEATSLYLSHIRHSWDSERAEGSYDDEFSEQEIVLTVPASFDEVARRLTVQAAKNAGYRKLTLLEEPLAAFYSFLAMSGGKTIPVGATVLVVDVGGGTSDFSLIEKTESGFQRQLVGQHLLLGGDNMDFMLAHMLESRFDGTVEPFQWQEVIGHGRRAKEALLDGTGQYKATLQGAGSSVVGGSQTAFISSEEVQKALLEGFFPLEPLEIAQGDLKRPALRTLGLPFEVEASILRHLCHFLEKSPDYVLFNGGAMKACCFRERILDALHLWYGKRPKVLPISSLDLAVSYGAAHFALARRGYAETVGAGAARAYYLGLGDRAMAVLERGKREGESQRLEGILRAYPNRPVQIQLYSSHMRLGDKVGDVVDISPEDLQAMPTLKTVLRYGKKGRLDPVDVTLAAELTTLGTLDLRLESPGKRWDLEFQVLTASSGDETRAADATYSKDEIEEVFSALLDNLKSKPEKAIAKIQELTGLEKDAFPPSLLRGLFDRIMDAKLCLNSEGEARLWNLLGFFLRPGYGYPLDDHRVTKLWRRILREKARTVPEKVLIQRWIAYRRIAGGLSRGQQKQLAGELLPLVLDKKREKILKVDKGAGYSYSEKLRALAAFELLPTKDKQLLGEALVKKVEGGPSQRAERWALGRIGARRQVVGSVADVVPREVAELWVERLQRCRCTGPISSIAAPSGEKEVDFSREQLEAWSVDGKVATWSRDDEKEVFGESLPQGLELCLVTTI